MASLPPASVAVDLSRLPPPQVVETLDFETIKARILAEFQSRYADFDALVESDPAMKLVEVFAYRELLMRQNFNERAVSMLLPFATGADLENLGAYFGVGRLDGESDTALLRRIQLAPDSYSVAGPESAYVFHALSADVTISDASAIMAAPGEVLVTLLNEAGDGTATPEQIAAVEAIVTHDEVRPLTDSVSVQSAQIVGYTIHARLHIAYGPDTALVLSTAQAALDTYLAQRRRLGRLVSYSGHAGALQVAGVETLELISPAADIAISRTQAAHPTSILVEVA
ncbi:baseplate J/gp47 family protein [Sphingobium sp. WTD-1]|uniref:baseplate assembly protein n=1 Tax=Sphingobium sp. WTD-1 TaxID=2979467 RepID=UPI0024DE6B2C|nr:baseplate J/gp47 family protein [Sphingobium sp. WTD-1]WIA56548.1 baseplate J/gp47 family protein [Sphingobium sp. WTD-1]